MGYESNGHVEETETERELRKIARRARSWIRLHPEDAMRTLRDAGKLPPCKCFGGEGDLELEELEDAEGL